MDLREDIVKKEKSIAIQYALKKSYEIQCESPNIKASRKLLEQARKR